MKKFSTLFIVFAFSIASVFGQLKIKTGGQVEINGLSGSFSTQAPRVSINSHGTSIGSVNTGLTLLNINTILDNWTRLHFATKKTDNTEEDFISLAAQ